MGRLIVVFAFDGYFSAGGEGEHGWEGGKVRGGGRIVRGEKIK